MYVAPVYYFGWLSLYLPRGEIHIVGGEKKENGMSSSEF